MEYEMQPVGKTINDGAEIVVDNGDGVAPEERRLLPPQAGRNGEAMVVDHIAEDRRNLEGRNANHQAGRNGEAMVVDHIAEDQRNLEGRNANQQNPVCTLLDRVAFLRDKPWMVIIPIAVLILIVIAISLALCSVIHEDVDEKYDRSSFRIPQYFNGSFRVTNQALAEELSSHSSNDSKVLITELQEKLTNLYSSSPALGRYFSTAEVYTFRNASAVADYRLMFVIPEQHDQLKNFTLSREMVYNVLRQFLYDQETDESGPTYIEPRSLSMV